MQIVKQQFAFGLGKFSKQFSNVFIGEFADDELKVSEILSDDLNFTDTHGSHFEKLGE